MKSRNLMLGILLIAVGVVALLVSLDVIDFSWLVLRKLWPLLFVFVGIWILPVKDWLKALLLLVTLALGVWLYHYEDAHRGLNWPFACAEKSSYEVLAV